MYVRSAGNTDLKWPVILVLTLFGGAVLLGLTLTNTDLFNGNLTSAKKLEIETKVANESAKAHEELRRQQALNEEEIRRQKALTEEALRHQQEINKLEEAQRARDMERDAMLRVLATCVGLVVVSLAALILAGGVAYRIYSTHRIELGEVEARRLEQEARVLTEKRRLAQEERLHLVRGNGHTEDRVVQ